MRTDRVPKEFTGALRDIIEQVWHDAKIKIKTDLDGSATNILSIKEPEGYPERIGFVLWADEHDETILRISVGHEFFWEGELEKIEPAGSLDLTVRRSHFRELAAWAVQRQKLLWMNQGKNFMSVKLPDPPYPVVYEYQDDESDGRALATAVEEGLPVEA